MLRQITNQYPYALIRRWSYDTCILFMASLLIGAVLDLGKALGGSLGSYVLALALLSAMTILVLYVILTESHKTEPRRVAVESLAKHPDQEQAA